MSSGPLVNQDQQLAEIWGILRRNALGARAAFDGLSQQQIQLWQQQGQAWADRTQNLDAQFETLFPSQVTGFDEQGFPIGVDRPPPARLALQFQFLSERAVAERNALRRRDAIRSIGQARTVFESFRPGGASALAAGIPQQQAQFLFADQIEAPDLLSDFRRDEAFQTRRRNNRARNTQLAVQAVTAVASAAVTAGGGGGAPPVAPPPEGGPTGTTPSTIANVQAQGGLQAQVTPEQVGTQQVAQAGIIAPQGGELQPGQAQGGAVPGAPVPGPQVLGAETGLGSLPVSGGPVGGPLPEGGPVGGPVGAAAPQVPGPEASSVVQPGSPVAMGDFSSAGLAATAHSGMGILGDSLATIIAADVIEESAAFFDSIERLADSFLQGASA